MNKLLISLLFVSFPTLAVENISYFDSNRNEVKLIKDKKENLLISENCNKKCLAFTSLKKVNRKLIEENFSQNPAATICEEQLKAELISLKNPQGGFSSFCRFKDKSLIETSLLLFHAP